MLAGHCGVRAVAAHPELAPLLRENADPELSELALKLGGKLPCGKLREEQRR